MLLAASVLCGCASAPASAPVAGDPPQTSIEPVEETPREVVPVPEPAAAEVTPAVVVEETVAPPARAHEPEPPVTLPVEHVPDSAPVAIEPPVAAPVVAIDAQPAPAVPADVDDKSVAFLRAGETLAFKMNWGILSNIGETRIETMEETVGDSRRFRIKISTKSRGLLDAIYPVVNDSESVIERSTGRPLEITIEGKSGKRPTKTYTVFDYEAGRIVHTDYIRPTRDGTAELPPEPAYDLMVAMLQSRDWNMQPGEKREVLTAFEDEFYFITLTAHWREKVKTGAGTFEAVMIEPTQVGEQKGFFKRGGSMRYWISDGPHPQVVKMLFKTKAGTLTALLDR
ncbi:MAG TPA: DUF3108 domain-containing protein [Opitutaceae bacterium]